MVKSHIYSYFIENDRNFKFDYISKTRAHRAKHFSVLESASKTDLETTKTSYAADKN